MKNINKIMFLIALGIFTTFTINFLYKINNNDYEMIDPQIDQMLHLNEISARTLMKFADECKKDLEEKKSKWEIDKKLILPIEI